MKRTKSQSPMLIEERRRHILSLIQKHEGVLVLFLLLCSFRASYAAQAAVPLSGQWTGTWAASPKAQLNTTSVAGTDGTTFREMVHTSIGGTSVRIILTNEFGLQPLTVSAAKIAISEGGVAIEPSAAKSLNFGGQASVTLPAGALMVSDPVELKLPAATDVAVSLFLPAQTIRQSTVHSYALQTNYKAAGNVIDERTLPNSAKVSSWYFIKGVTVETDVKSTTGGVVVALGDSITDGAASKPNKNGRWPDGVRGVF